MPLASTLTQKHAHIHIDAGKAITFGSLALQVFVGCRTIKLLLLRKKQTEWLCTALLQLPYPISLNEAELPALRACVRACAEEKLRDSEATLLWRRTRRSKTQQKSYFVEI